MIKRFFFFLSVFMLSANTIFASDNFSNSDWWRQATIEDVEKEINSGADINASNEYGESALMLAIKNKKDFKIVKLLIDSGADVNAKNNDKIVFHIKKAINDGDQNIMSELKRYDSNINDINSLNDEVLKNVLRKGGSRIIPYISRYLGPETLLKCGSSTLIYSLMYSNDSKIIKLLIDKGADINARNDLLETALMRSACRGEYEVVKLLIDAGADVNVTDIAGQTPLINSIGCNRSNKNPEVIKLLIDSGADVNAKEHFGETALFLAAGDLNNADVVKTIIEAGADINAKNIYGWTALYIAYMRDNKEALNALLKAGACDDNKDDICKKLADIKGL